MESIAREALERWAIAPRTCTVVAQRENTVLRVEARDGKLFALRIHRPGYRSLDELKSELAWMAALAAGGVSVPAPVPALSGELVVQADSFNIDLLTWLPGQPLGKTGAPLALRNAREVFFALGGEMAKFHVASDAWQRPASFTRRAWDVDGLLGEEPVWGRFWDNPGLSDSQRSIIVSARQKARAELEALAADLDYGLIHADLVRENVLIDGGRLHLVDFDDGGFGFRLFDLATALLKNRGEPGYAGIETSLIAGYRSVRPLDSSCLRLFLLLRAFTYLGWIIGRMSEADAGARNARFIAESVRLAKDYLG